MLTTEPNFSRKSHRVDIPLYVQINEHTYQALDWSITGLAIKPEKDEVFESESELPAKLLLPMKEAQLNLNVHIAVRRIDEDKVGFEFVDLDATTRRVLRHYIQMHVDGKLDSAEDMMAMATAPNIDSPLEDAINVSETEQTLLKRFRHRGLITAGIILLFILVFAGILFYNTDYRLEEPGIVYGNVERVTANYGGIIQHVEAKMGTYVPAGTPLFKLMNTSSNALRGTFLGTHLVTSRNLKTERRLLHSLYRDMIAADHSYRNAKHLFDQRLITRKDLENTHNNYLSSRTAYFRQLSRVKGSHIYHDGKSIDGLPPLYPTIHAKHAGTVIAISAKPGQYVGANDVVVILQRNNTPPKVVFSVTNREALKLHQGMPATVYVPSQNQNYWGHVASIGRPQINTQATDSMDASLNKTLVSVTFNKASVRIPYGTRVHVWLKTF